MGRDGDGERNPSPLGKTELRDRDYYMPTCFCLAWALPWQLISGDTHLSFRFVNVYSRHSHRWNVPEGIVPGPVGVKEVHPMALHKASSVSPVSGCAFSPSRKSGRQPAGLSGGNQFTAAVCLLS